jgi:hypothetical protein
VLEAIPIYWVTLAWVMKGILDKLCQVSLHFLWIGKYDGKSLVLASWKKIFVPKKLGRWGIKKSLSLSRGSRCKNILVPYTRHLFMG